MIRSTACSQPGSPPCPLPTDGSLFEGPLPDGSSAATEPARGFDDVYAFLMNVTGSGSKTLETVAIPSPFSSSLATVSSAVTYVADGFVVNYPGGAQYTLDVGAVGGH